MKREKLEFLLENALHTQRFARYVGRRCRSGTIKDIAAATMFLDKKRCINRTWIAPHRFGD